MKNGDQYQVRSVLRAISILKVFINSSGSISLTEISRETGLNQVTAYRLATTLLNAGFLELSSESGKYRLGVMAMALGEAYYRSNDLRQRAHPKLVELRDTCGETVHLAILDGNQIVYIEKLPGLHAIGLMSSRVGGRAPAYCTAVGKMLLAYESEECVRSLYEETDLLAFTPHSITTIDQLLVELTKIRATGFALDQEEHEIGVGCVAAPIFDQTRIIAAISLSGPFDRIMKSCPELAQLTVRIAADISFLFGSMFNPLRTIPQKEA